MVENRRSCMMMICCVYGVCLRRCLFSLPPCPCKQKSEGVGGYTGLDGRDMLMHYSCCPREKQRLKLSYTDRPRISIVTIGYRSLSLQSRVRQETQKKSVISPWDAKDGQCLPPSRHTPPAAFLLLVVRSLVLFLTLAE